MTADLSAAADNVRAETSPAEPAQSGAKPDAKPAKYEVVRQYSHRSDKHVCTHRYEAIAELCAYLRESSHPTETGVHYTVHRAAS